MEISANKKTIIGEGFGKKRIENISTMAHTIPQQCLRYMWCLSIQILTDNPRRLEIKSGLI